MANLILSGSTSGSVTLSSPAVSGTTTLTLPTTSGTVITTGSTFAGTGPAFFAYNSGTQSISGSTHTKLVLNSEYWDTNNNFDSTTNYRFTPTVAGYYQLNSGIYAATSSNIFTQIYKNGSTFVRLSNFSALSGMLLGSCLVYANGSTDYFELYFYSSAGNTAGAGGADLFWFNGFLARAA
jgi:hypothetical protein